MMALVWRVRDSAQRVGDDGLALFSIGEKRRLATQHAFRRARSLASFFHADKGMRVAAIRIQVSGRTVFIAMSVVDALLQRGR